MTEIFGNGSKLDLFVETLEVGTDLSQNFLTVGDLETALNRFIIDINRERQKSVIRPERDEFDVHDLGFLLRIHKIDFDLLIVIF